MESERIVLLPDNYKLAFSSHNKPGHLLTLHPLVSLVTPWQGFPLFAGAGFVQLRLRV